MATPIAYKIVDEFERVIAKYAGSKYAVAVESCTAALFLSLMYRKTISGLELPVCIPKLTYPSVPASIIHAGGKVKFTDETWEGTYDLLPYNIIDGALRFKRGMFHGGLHCLSFHAKKLLPIGRGGMILTDDENAYKWLLRARFDGRTQGVPLDEENFDMLGWNVYMTPEQAARGLQIFDMIKGQTLDDIKSKTQGYPDLSRFPIYGI